MERGVCICPDCGLQFQDATKAAMERENEALRSHTRALGRPDLIGEPWPDAETILSINTDQAKRGFTLPGFAEREAFYQRVCEHKTRRSTG